MWSKDKGRFLCPKEIPFMEVAKDGSAINNLRQEHTLILTPDEGPMTRLAATGSTEMEGKG